MNGMNMNNFSRNYSSSQNPLENFKEFFRNNNMLVKLIVINVVVWLIIMFTGVIFDLFNADFTEGLLQWLAVPASLEKLLFRFWTPFTYMFLHYDFWHILFNMLWLYWFGRIFLEYLNERQLLATYLFGGLAGASFYILSFNVFPKFENMLGTEMLGASGSVMAIVIAISFYVPNYRINLIFLGPVKIYYIAVFFIILDILMIRSSNSGGHIAHLGGAIWGFYYIYMLRKGTDISTLLNSIPKVKWSTGKKKARKSGFKNVYTNTRTVSDEDYNLQKKKNQEQVDRILEKISKSGYESLTREEKELLFRTSNKKE